MRLYINASRPKISYDIGIHKVYSSQAYIVLIDWMHIDIYIAYIQNTLNKFIFTVHKGYKYYEVAFIEP